MINIAGYQIRELLSKNIKTSVYRGIKSDSNKSYIIKVLNNDYPLPEEIAKLRHEFDIVKDINIEGIVKAHEIIKYNNSLALILEDFQGITLSEYIKSQIMTIETFLNYAIQLTKILGRIHSCNIIHKDIKPSNIILNIEKEEIMITDFSIATILSKEELLIKNPNMIEGTLPYISPEQTGRVNRSIDYRSDFYSLGVTFYEMLTGKTPFVTDDPTEMIHFHIAKKPISLNSINQTIPIAISSIVLKLLSKNAEERYQSTFGLKNDLEKCLIQLNKTGIIENFEIGTKDIYDKFRISEKIYGRDMEIESLLKVFNRVCHGNTEILLVTGQAGIGKSFLINDINKPILEKNGFFISGKFEEFKRNIPYFAFVQAFKEIILEILTYSETEVEKWRDRILKVLGNNGELIVKVIPEIELIIGKQSSLSTLPLIEEQNRFNLTFINFIKVFCTKDHPLVLFLDDLQWGDIASLKLLDLLMTNNDIKYLFLIGSYRDNEIEKNHQLKIILDELEKKGKEIKKLYLKPLDNIHVDELIAETLNLSIQETKELSEWCYIKTGGNPFFLNQFLHFLSDNRYIRFDSKDGKWIWSIEEVMSSAITENVLEFMKDRILHLSKQTQEILKYASCIGSIFELKLLSKFTENSPKICSGYLWEALQEGIIVPTNSSYKYINEYEELDVTYKFLHDRVLQAVYTLINEDEKKEFHLKLGRLILRGLNSHDIEEKIFTIINHLNMGESIITNDTEKQELAILNMIGGRKALGSNAYIPALNYLNNGIRIIKNDFWKNNYEMSIQMYQLAAQASFYTGNIERTDFFTATIIENGASISEKTIAYEIQIQSLVSQGKLVEAVEFGINILKNLGVKLPKKASQNDIIKELIITKMSLGNKKIEELEKMKKLTDEKSNAKLRLMFSIGVTANFVAPELIPLIVFKSIRIQIKHGFNDYGVLLICDYGFMLAGIGDVEQGYKYGILSQDLVRKYNIKNRAHINFIFEFFIRHWKESLRNSLDSLIEGYKIGLETGNFEMASCCLNGYFPFLYFSGHTLDFVMDEIKKYANILIYMKHSSSINITGIYYKTISYMLGFDDDFYAGKHFGNEDFYKGLIEQKDYASIFVYHINSAITKYSYEDYKEALADIAECEKVEKAAFSTYYLTLLAFYSSLIRLEVLNQTADEIDNRELNITLNLINKNQKKMKNWAKNSSVNFLHKYYLVEAEKYRLFKNECKALEMYDLAIKHASENEFINEEALACELAAKFYLSINKEKVAIVFLKDAYYLYTKWGNIRKIKYLEKKHPNLISKFCINNVDADFGNHIMTVTQSTDSSKKLDMISVMKASNAISEEIVYDNLLKKLLTIVIESAGAEKVLFVVKEREEYKVEGMAYFDKNNLLVSKYELDDSVIEFPESIINFIDRTKETVLVKNGSKDKKYKNDSYIQKYQPISILSLPVISKGNQKGIIYLENNLTEGAFNSNRVEVLKMLSIQMAISLENSKMYNNLEELVNERTKELQHNIRKLEETQEQLIISEKIASMGKFAGTIAHEINSPLAAINTGTELIEIDLDSIENIELREDIADNIKMIKDATKKSRNIILKLLKYSDKTKRKADILFIGDILKAVVGFFELESIKLGIYLQLVSEDDFRIKGIESELVTVFNNIIENSIYALKNREKGYIRIAVAKKNEKITVEIEDNGNGMVEDVLIKAFDPFFTTKGVGEGMGLGLTVAYDLLRQHKAFIHISSEVNKGTIVTVKFDEYIDEDIGNEIQV